jgi:hypothetical protein
MVVSMPLVSVSGPLVVGSVVVGIVVLGDVGDVADADTVGSDPPVLSSESPLVESDGVPSIGQAVSNSNEAMEDRAKVMVAASVRAGALACQATAFVSQELPPFAAVTRAGVRGVSGLDDLLRSSVHDRALARPGRVRGGRRSARVRS